MAKKARKTIGRFASLNLRGQRFTVAKFDAALEYARPAMMAALGDLRRSGGSLREHVFIVADVAHEGSLLLVRDLVGDANARPEPGFIGIIPAKDAAVVLRKYEAEEQAVQTEA